MKKRKKKSIKWPRIPVPPPCQYHKPQHKYSRKKKHKPQEQTED